MLVAGSLMAVFVFILLGLLTWMNEGCTPAEAEQKALDVGEIAIADAVCVSENLALPDALIVSKCSPGASATQTAETRTVNVTKYVFYCRHPELLDAGYQAGDGPIE